MNHLIDGLVAQNAISPDTIITAWYTFKDVNGRFIKRTDDFRFVKYNKTNSSELTLMNLFDRSIVTIPASSVITIDGMVPSRYIDVYDMNPDGSYKKIGKKRGRKSKQSH